MTLSLKEKLSHLPIDKIQWIEVIVEQILKSSRAEMIILYGSYARGDYRKEEIRHVGGHNILFRSDYDILVITDLPCDNETVVDDRDCSPPKTETDTEADLMNRLCKLKVPVQLIVESIDDFNHYLQEWRYFYLDIYREGIVLYDSEKCAIEPPPTELPHEVRLQHAEEDFDEWFNLGKDHLRMAEFGVSGEIYNLAAFNLEQAGEAFYRAVVLVYTHYSPHEHNLFVLREKAEEHCTFLKKILPRDTPEGARLFKKLHLAYVESRYFKMYHVTMEEIEYWQAGLKELAEQVEIICRERIESLRKSK